MRIAIIALAISVAGCSFQAPIAFSLDPFDRGVKAEALKNHEQRLQGLESFAKQVVEASKKKE